MGAHINMVAYLRVWGVVCLPLVGWVVGKQFVQGYRRRRLAKNPAASRPVIWCTCPVPDDRKDLPFTPVCTFCGSYISAAHWRNTAAARAARDARDAGAGGSTPH